ncbi:hypothetical protein AAFF_G00315470 [Aldrovandia affinis]|uniref:Secreted protein n=1 Tax=Aldrovandia affinis TaxID=143900 RepID=A0AAD7WQI1_9TELE|nr:hypothetical protein AAFF_G00315470 [Aldrovandia affinis]
MFGLGSPLLFLLRSPPWWGWRMWRTAPVVWRWPLLGRRHQSCSPPCLSLHRQSLGSFPVPIIGGGGPPLHVRSGDPCRMRGLHGARG